MDRFDLHRPQQVSAPSPPPPQPNPSASPFPSAPTPADTAPDTLSSWDRGNAAGDRDVASLSGDRAAVPSQGSTSASALLLESYIAKRGMPVGRGGHFMEGGVEGLQAVLQDSSTALQQELLTAEAKMEVCLR